VAAKGSPEFMGRETPSFADFLTAYAPDLLPGAGQRLTGGAGSPAGAEVIDGLPHATTLIAATCDHGVVVAGDRRATAGSMIAHRDVVKVFRSDEYSAIGMAGVASVGLDLIRLFQVELEHYEKMEGRSLSLDGKANRLATMVRGNLMGAMQGLVVIPLFAGYDEDAGRGRIFSYDVAGGPYEEYRFHSIGSGSVFARGAMKKLYGDGMSVRDTVLACVQSLYDAADDDSATGGPDMARRIFPVIATVTADGYRRLSDTESEEYTRQVVDSRMSSPDGPPAPLRGSN
jgi:proteasome beta subunit